MKWQMVVGSANGCDWSVEASCFLLFVEELCGWGKVI